MEPEHEVFFGELLQRFRARKKLTQRQLATLIGASREAISLWERGVYKPETLAMLHELVRVLALDDDEKRLLFEAHVGTASVLPLHNLPEHNPYFIGREEILKSLHTHLRAGKQVAVIQTQASAVWEALAKPRLPLNMPIASVSTITTFSGLQQIPVKPW